MTHTGVFMQVNVFFLYFGVYDGLGAGCRVGLYLQRVFRGTCRAVTQACQNTATPCFCPFGPRTTTLSVLGQGGGDSCCDFHWASYL